MVISPEVIETFLQYRDFLLFLLSFTKIKENNFKIDYEKIINKYCELTNNIEFKQKLIRFSKKLQFSKMCIVLILIMFSVMLI